MMDKLVLKLYVTGKTPRSLKAISNLETLLKDQLDKGQYELEIVNIFEQPQLAEDEKIFATPTLIKELPEPIRRIVGDLSDEEKVLLGLDLVKKG